MPLAAVILAAAIAVVGSIQQDDLADAIYGDGVSSGTAPTRLLSDFPRAHIERCA